MVPVLCQTIYENPERWALLVRTARYGSLEKRGLTVLRPSRENLHCRALGWNETTSNRNRATHRCQRTWDKRFPLKWQADSPDGLPVSCVAYIGGDRFASRSSRAAQRKIAHPADSTGCGAR